MRYLLLFLGFGFLLSSCDGPAARFDTFSIVRPVNLAKELGHELTLVARDTLQLRLQSDPASGSTLITNTDDSTVLLDARIFYRRGLYYAVEDLKSGCWVHAFRVHRNQVQGLATGYKQMEDLSTLVQHGNFADLARYRSLSDDSIRLRFDARLLRRFYLAELDSFPRYRITTAPPGLAAAVTVAPADQLSLHPNPAATITTLTFTTAAPRTVSVYNASGQLMRTIPAQTARTAISVQDLPAGTYVVRVTSATHPAQTARLLVQP
ncbi:T9SS type A sorting domain-containing protein [Hymenobacter lucidus]|uniref:T9SS type A sorting domain-containing protein n=1 Tax=Hymenobacter lucidus TaxID=2880930 RepID=A0ABS8AP69_9BACT|nr:T9SS type A sorting domain-containing protein [Hymenobacter lucidus]MCB2407818.1 T9SS type A sorting domain-containing protein [Hymenobacter lucidus]